MKGGLVGSPERLGWVVSEDAEGQGGEGENWAGLSSSDFRIDSSEEVESQGGGAMFARFWRWRRKAR
jgi:hypothetical protein